MSFFEIAKIMWPFWTLGLWMIFLVRKTEHKKLLRIEWNIVLQWLGFLSLLTAYRVIMFKHFPHLFPSDTLTGAMQIPWQMTFTVFWEDACHTLPLALLRKILGTSKLMMPIHYLLMLMVMLSFGLGHTYQGVGAAAVLSLYIPITLGIARDRGFGTVMINHVLYDLSTVLFLRWIVMQ